METIPADIMTCAVHSIDSLGADVFQVKLRLAEMPAQAHIAGQYLLLATETSEFYPFSIASAPQQLPELELHILARDNTAVELLQQLRETPMARVQLPMGDVHVDVLDSRPLLLIAAGTGLAQMHSMLEAARLSKSNTAIHLYWGARTEDDFYQVASADLWCAMPNVRLHKIVSEDADWNGRSGLLYEAVCHDIRDFADWRVVASGSPTMVYATLDALVAAGMQEEQMQADVFSYAPRPA